MSVNEDPENRSLGTVQLAMGPLDAVAVIGYAARLPGAEDADRFWDLLASGESAIGLVPEDRWSAQKFNGAPATAPGRSITRAAGVLDDIWSFDAARFNISPREARQMDPQQRILLETVAAAFDHAGVDPDRLDKDRTGVFVGASAADHSTTALQDPTEVEGHFMLGNTLSIIANRISFTWDLRGPSITVDTACSSSLVALDQACNSLRTGRIDTAVVAGVSILLSPLPFVGFSQAGMLSATGRCRPFAAGADGYVRSEGAVVIVLQRLGLATELGLQVRSVVAGTGVNTVGRAPGIAMPSAERQGELMRAVMTQSGVSPDDVVYLEAHGTGTPVGDPVEAQAIGEVFGGRRAPRLAIGSVKSNIGHLEPASGLAGLLKAQLVLEKGRIPPTLHADAPNPAIDFTGLNLDLVDDLRDLPEIGRPRIVGVNSFGFGGVNAHVLLREAPAELPVEPTDIPPSLFLTAPSQTGLKQQAEAWRKRVCDPGQPDDLGRLVSNANWNRTRHRYRLSIAAGSRATLSDQIDLWLSGQHVDSAASDALGANLPLAFVFSGNGSVWPGMGHDLFRSDPVFRDAFDAFSGISRATGGPDLVAALFSPDLATHLADGEIAQPLCLAIQVALCRSLDSLGVRPAACLGHSLGEIAAAVVAGRVTDEAAVKLVLYRAEVLAALRGTGTMAAFSDRRETIAGLIAAHRIEADVTAENAPSQVTVSGTASQLNTLLKVARRNRIAGKLLDIDYPYHGRAVRALETALRDKLTGLAVPQFEPTARFYSGSFGDLRDNRPLDAEYWVQNAVRPVEFRSAVESACRDGFRLFLEISPKTVVGGYLRMILDGQAVNGRVFESLDPRKSSQRSAASIARKIHASGGAVDEAAILGPRQAYRSVPPAVAFERKTFRLAPEHGPDIFGRAAPHPLLGAEVERGALRWRSTLSLDLLPWLAQHRVSGRVLLPATAMVEMLAEAARQALPAACAPELRDVEFMRPVEIPAVGIVDLLTEWERGSRRIILSQRLGEDWVPTAVCRAFSGSVGEDEPAKTAAIEGQVLAGFYDRLRAQGLDYGPLFARADRVELADDNTARVRIASAPPAEVGCTIDAAAADATLHLAAALIQRAGVQASGPMVPTRIGRVRMPAAGRIDRADLVLHRATTDGAHLDVWMRDEGGRILLQFDELRLRPLPEGGSGLPDLWEELFIPLAGQTLVDLPALRKSLARPSEAEPADIDILRAALAARTAWDIVADSLASTDVADKDLLVLCTNWMVAGGFARFGGQGLALAGPCPWPAVDVLLPALGQVPGAGNIELSSLLEVLAPGEAAGPRTFVPLRRLQAALQDALAVIQPKGRIALVGPVGRRVVEQIVALGHAATLVTPDSATRDTAQIEFADIPRLRIVELATPSLAGSFDLVIGAHLAQTIPLQMLGALASLPAHGGSLMTLEETSDLFALLTGRHRDVTAVDAFSAALAREGIAVERQASAASETVLLLSGQRPASGMKALRMDVDGKGAWADALRAMSDSDAADHVAVTVLDKSTNPFGGDILRVLRALPSATTHWIVDPGLSRFEALTGWRRVVVNETGRDLRVLSVSEDADFAALLRILTSGQETEVRLDGGHASSPRLVPGPSPAAICEGLQALRLHTPPRGSTTGRLTWKPESRKQPKDGEVEIAVEAVGLNFRDVMWAQGMLPPEGLEGGFAGLGLGMECAGRIVGTDASGQFSPGQAVATFAPHAFSTHVTVPVHAVLPLPDTLSMAEGASLPVAMLTADYALVELARLAPGETVLVHGGAGGVGLAAIQIAQRLGARIIATAGTPARRRYLKMMGAETTCDSRSLAFVDTVMRATGGRGVDVILNSLHGEALELGLSCLAPFGRFVELGKRDIFQNSTIGLRALKNNISVMAVDVDQLMQHRPQVAKRATTRIGEGLVSGDLQPLPVSVFEACETDDAFRLMQRSGQIGKVVVRPPTLPSRTPSKATLDFGASWLVTGGTEGFGLATAEWLVRHGVRRLWLTSRSGRLSDDAKARLQPAEVHLCAADVSDTRAMNIVADEIMARNGGLDGIVHAAGVLQDGLFSNLSDDQISQVHRPKVQGAEVLDLLAQRLDPRHFWLYSSVAARFGNPGQAPYAAANRAIEALARRRQAQGLPALAIAWGPITDVGMLDRLPERRAALEQTLGALQTAGQALERLHRFLQEEFSGPAITIAPMAWGRLTGTVRVLDEPLFDFVPQIKLGQIQGQSLAALTSELGEAKARKEVLSIIQAQLANVLRCSPSEIDPARPLADHGFDSLMAVGLRLAIEERLGVELSFQSLGAETTLNELVHRLFMQTGASKTETAAAFLETMHVTGSALSDGVRDRILSSLDAGKS